MLLRLVRSGVRNIVRLLLGPAANAGRQVADPEQRIAMPDRMLEEADRLYSEGSVPPRRVGHLTVHDGGRIGAPNGDGPLGRPTPVLRGGRRAARG